MTPTAVALEIPEERLDASSRGEDRFGRQPRSLADTGLSEIRLAELVAKHLHSAGVLPLEDLARRVALPGAVVEEILGFLRREHFAEVRPNREERGTLRYALTERGRALALDAKMRSAYVGPAPVPLEHYTEVVRAQSIHRRGVTRGTMQVVFGDMVLQPGLVDRLGPSLNSGRAIFVYGPAGTGKTFVTRRIARLFDDAVLVPHAVAVNDAVIPVFDPVFHRTEPTRDAGKLLFEARLDGRYAVCRRPMVLTGGELTADMLDVSFDPRSRLYRAPLQMKAANGVFIIDDLGRQRVAPATVLNRWIVPMEEGIDYLSTGAGQHFSVPFDVVLVFSTNLDPLELADEAFLRRIGYKIRFDALEKPEYSAIWRGVCAQWGVEFDPAVLDFVVDRLHRENDVPLLPCHPRDLVGIALDHARYRDEPAVLTREALEWAWRNYFVRLSDPAGNPDDSIPSTPET